MAVWRIGLLGFALGAFACSADGLSRIPTEVAEAARTRGPVRVIVQLVQPPGTSVAAAQDAVLAELAGSDHRLLHRYLNSAALALEVGEDALRVLGRSPHVRSVAGDFELRPN